MSEEIVDVSSQEVPLTPVETVDDSGVIIPDPQLVENVSEEGLKEIEARREEIKQMIPPYPSEWQDASENLDSEDSDESFSESSTPSVMANFKKDEINKLIKKYKKYLRSNLSEIRRLES